MADAYKQYKGHEDINALAICTGKPLKMGGIQGRTEATGFGVFYAMRYLMKNQELCQKHELTPGLKEKTYIVQGFGNVGYYAAKALKEEGAKMIGVIERDVTIFNENGIDPDKVLEFRKQNPEKSIKGFPDAKIVPMTEAFYAPCDFLIMAAQEKAIHKENANLLNCKVVVEGANGPTTFEGDKILEQRNIAVFPDLLVNGGGVFVSYLEYLKNLRHRVPGKMTKR